MMKVDFSSVNYIANGNALNATSLNKPSVSLEARTTELRRASLSSNIEKSITDSAVYSIHRSENSVLPEGSWAIKVTAHLDTYSIQNLSKQVSYSFGLVVPDYSDSYINISSSLFNKGKYTIKHSDLSSLFGGYASSYSGSRLKNNGDSICVKVPRQHSLTVNTGLNSAVQLKSTNNHDITFSTINSNVYELVKLPLLDTIQVTTTLSLTTLNTYVGISSSNLYKIVVDANSVPVLTDIATDTSVANSKLYVSFADSVSPPKYELATMVIESGNVVGLTLVVDGDNLPSDYVTDSSIDFKLWYSVSGISQEIAEIASSAKIAVQSLNEDYVYLPIACKKSDSIEFLNGLYSIPLISFSDINEETSANATVDQYLTESGLNWGFYAGKEITALGRIKHGVPDLFNYSYDYYNKDLAAYLTYVAKSGIKLLLSEIQVDTLDVPNILNLPGLPHICIRNYSNSDRVYTRLIDKSLSTISYKQFLGTTITSLGTAILQFDLCDSNNELGNRGYALGSINHNVSQLSSFDILLRVKVLITDQTSFV
jgi:hypothetical protein